MVSLYNFEWTTSKQTKSPLLHTPLQLPCYLQTFTCFFLRNSLPLIIDQVQYTTRIVVTFEFVELR